MGRKSQPKKEKNIEDLDQKISTFYTQNEKEREKALLDLITKIIVEATLREYYETKSSFENEGE
jgi:hypothetical protein